MFTDRSLNIGFSLLLIATVVLFSQWGLAYTSESAPLLFFVAAAVGLFMAFNIGGNDVANSFGTSVGAGTLTIKQALLIAAIFEVSGAIFAGGAVTDTIRKGIVDLQPLASRDDFDPMNFVYVMMSALFAAAFWLLFATRKGLPVSTTHAIIGGIVGSSIMLGVTVLGGSGALALIHWGQIGQIVVSWVLSPLLGGVIAWFLFGLIKRYVIAYNTYARRQLQSNEFRQKSLQEQHDEFVESLDPDARAEIARQLARDAALHNKDQNAPPERFETSFYRDLRGIIDDRESINSHRAVVSYVPIIAALGSMIITAMVFIKGLKQIKMDFSTAEYFLITLMVAAIVWASVYVVARTLRDTCPHRSTFMLFSWLQVFTAAAFAFSHGSNDIANAIGPFAAILDVLQTGTINAKAPVPPAAMFSFGIAMVVGLWFIGKEVIQTVGSELTRMHPASGFAAELSAASVVLIASTFGIPVSSTHILVGAVLGIGIVNRNTNWHLMRPIGLAWVITLPAAALLSALAFVVLSAVL
jgi:PiT family inorganic phosphate transporter